MDAGFMERVRAVREYTLDAIDAEKDWHCNLEIQKEVVGRWAGLNGWQPWNMASGVEVWNGRRLCCRRYVTNSEYFDHPLYFRDRATRRLAAVVGQPYHMPAVPMNWWGRFNAREQWGRLAWHIPPAPRASFHNPGSCYLLVITPPGVKVEWLDEQHDERWAEEFKPGEWAELQKAWLEPCPGLEPVRFEIPDNCLVDGRIALRKGLPWLNARAFVVERYADGRLRYWDKQFWLRRGDDWRPVSKDTLRAEVLQFLVEAGWSPRMADVNGICRELAGAVRLEVGPWAGGPADEEE
jgi:hypothetical protein